MELGAADIPTPSFGGYAMSSGHAVREDRTSKKDAVAPVARKTPSRGQLPARKSRLPVLEILVVVLLVAGAVAAVWMLRSSSPGKSAATVRNVDITISPANAKVVAGQSLDFSAVVSGTDDMHVSWTVQEGDDGGQIVTHGAKAEGGKVSSIAVYVAPKTPGTYHLLTTSQADPKKSAEAEITVTRATKH